MAVRSANDYMKNTAWVKRIQEFFTRVDQNNNGTIEAADFEVMLNNLARVAKRTDPKILERFRRIEMDKHIVAMGITPGKKLTSEEYVNNMAIMAAVEHGKLMRGEKLSLAEVNDAMYDVMDFNQDGSVSLDEFTTVMKIMYGCDAKEAEATFSRVDTNKNGRVEREELTDYELKFWFDLNDEASKGFYGAKYEV